MQYEIKNPRAFKQGRGDRIQADGKPDTKISNGQRGSLAVVVINKLDTRAGFAVHLLGGLLPG